MNIAHIPLPAILSTVGPAANLFKSMSAEKQKAYRNQAIDAIAAVFAAADASALADAEARVERRTRRATEKASRAAQMADYLKGLNLTSLEGRVRFFGAMHAGIAPLTEDLQTTGSAVGNTDPERILLGMKSEKLKNFAVDLPLPDSAMRGVCAWTGERATLDALCAKHGLPDTLEILNPSGTVTRLFSHTHRSRRAQFNGPDLWVNWKLTVTPDYNFGATITDRTLGHLPALPEKLDRWLAQCGEGSEKSFFDLLSA